MNAKINIKDSILETNRLVLGPFKRSDLDDFYAYAKVWGVGQMAGWLPHQSIKQSQEILEKFIEGEKTFAIVYKNNHKVIGSIGIENLTNIDEEKLKKLKGRELGFVLSKEYWGLGIMPEAVKKVIDYLFHDCNLDFITCSYFIDNNQSKRVQEKCGFKFLKKVILPTQMQEEKEGNLNIIYKNDIVS